MKKNIEYVFTSCYTAHGYVSFLPQLISRLDRIVVIEGCPGSGKSTFLRRTGLNLRERGYDIQFWLSPRDPAYLDGILIPQLKTALIDHDLLNCGTTFKNNLEMQFLDLSAYLKDDCDLKSEISDLHCCSSELSTQVIESLTRARDVRQEAEADKYFTVQGPQLYQISQNLSSEILDIANADGHFFASAVTSQGIVDYYEEISAKCSNRYVLSGAASCDKSQVMCQIAGNALARGFNVDYYHSKLNPDEVEMIIIKERSTAVVDAGVLQTSNKPGDIMIDILPSDNKYADTGANQDDENERRFNQLLYDAIERLARICEAEKKLSRMVTKSMEFEQLDACCEDLVQEILFMK